MCGMAGFVGSPNADDSLLSVLRAASSHMRKRGPDASGEWASVEGRVGLTHRRLAIIDLSERGSQPMHAGALTITFNGEIYNYKALRRELEEDGEFFRSDSDTEVLLMLYARLGSGMLEKLRGMYAFAIWDAQRNELFLARDPFGIKPLYYGKSSDGFWFASQARALADSGALDSKPDLRAWVQFLLWGSIPEPRTAYGAIRTLPAGSWMRVREDGTATEPQRYFRLAECFRTGREPRASADEVREAVLDSIRHHLIADVPVGVFLSAGIDSATVLGAACDVGPAPASVTLGFSEFEGQSRDEVPLAKQLATHYGSTHTVRRVDRAEFQSDLPKILAAMDQPSIDGINTWFVAKAARELGWKVALSGLGGDELFGGYPSFRDVPRWVKWLGWAQRTPKLAERAGRLLGRFARHPKAQGLLRYGGTWSGAYFLRRGLFMPWEVEAERPSWLPSDPGAIEESLLELDRLLTPDPGSDHARVSVLESGAYMRNQLLRDSDWASMAHSIELRVPLVDSVLATTLAPRMPAAVKGPAKAALARVPSRPFPDSIINRPKTGFETPVANWMEASNRRPGEPWARGWTRTLVERWPRDHGASH